MAKSYFITGATGFVGLNILRTLIKENTNDRITLLVRKCGGGSVLQRMICLLSEVCTQNETDEILKRIEVVEGDVTRENLGMSEAEYNKLAKSTNIIFHSAASIKFNLPLNEATEINVKGTKNMLAFAQLCRKNNTLEKYNHISTAYVTGRKKKARELSVQRDFINTYESTKFEAETIVDKHINTGLPGTIFRPSIIICNSHTGEISRNSILYIFLVLISRGMLTQLPADKDSSLNLVPINYFIDLMLKISRMQESNGRTFNICNEKNGEVRKIFSHICKQLGVYSPEYIPISSSNLLQQRLLSQIETFIPYFEESHTFDLYETRKILKDEYYACDDIYPSFDRMIKYCIDKQFLPFKSKSKRVLINE